MIVKLKSGETREYLPFSDGEDWVTYNAHAGAGGDLAIYRRRMRSTKDKWSLSLGAEHVAAIFAAGEWVSVE